MVFGARFEYGKYNDEKGFKTILLSLVLVNKNESEFIPWSRAWLSYVSNMSCEYDMAGLSYVLVFNTQNVQIV